MLRIEAILLLDCFYHQTLPYACLLALTLMWLVSQFICAHPHRIVAVDALIQAKLSDIALLHSLVVCLNGVVRGGGRLVQANGVY